MKAYFVILLFLFFTPLGALTLKDKMKKAVAGDFVVTEQGSQTHLLIINRVDLPVIAIEEISCPIGFRLKEGETWESWIKNEAPSHTSWTLLEIDLEKEDIIRCFAFDRNAWLLLNKDDSFLIKLLRLPLKRIPEERQKKIGPRPLEGPDMRKLWTPTLVHQGKKRINPHFDMYQVDWPTDSTPLSGKRIDLYFDKEDKNFPFPYWTQITDESEAAFKIRVIDSGRNLPPSGKQMPRDILKMSPKN